MQALFLTLSNVDGSVYDFGSALYAPTFHKYNLGFHEIDGIHVYSKISL